MRTERSILYPVETERSYAYEEILNFFHLFSIESQFLWTYETGLVNDIGSFEFLIDDRYYGEDEWGDWKGLDVYVSIPRKKLDRSDKSAFEKCVSMADFLGLKLAGPSEELTDIDDDLEVLGPWINIKSPHIPPETFMSMCLAIAEELKEQEGPDDNLPEEGIKEMEKQDSTISSEEEEEDWDVEDLEASMRQLRNSPENFNVNIDFQEYWTAVLMQAIDDSTRKDAESMIKKLVLLAADGTNEVVIGENEFHLNGDDIAIRWHDEEDSFFCNLYEIRDIKELCKTITKTYYRL